MSWSSSSEGGQINELAWRTIVNDITVFITLRAKLSSAVYYNRSCLWTCLQRAGRRCPNLTTASVRAVFASLWAFFFITSAFAQTSRCYLASFNFFLLLFILFPAGFRSPFLYGFSPQRKQIARQHLWSARKNFAHTLFHHHAIFGCFVLIFSAMCL